MKIKENSDDFIVEEVLKLELNPKGDYCYFILEKKDWTTLKALKFMASKLNVSPQRFGIAGQKDRKGVTRQYVSCYHLKQYKLEEMNLKDIHVEFIGYGDKPIGLGDLEGNKFKIRVRELKKPLKNIKHFVNYYGEQRFGGYRPNMHLVGKQFILGNYEEAAKLMICYPYAKETKNNREARRAMQEIWPDFKKAIRICPKQLTHERAILGHLARKPGDYKGSFKELPRQLYTMVPQAYQSYLFNESLSRYLRKFKHRESKYCCGKMVFVDEFLDLNWPLVDKGTKLDGEIKEVVEGLMKEESIWYDNFEFNKGLTRKAMVKLKDFWLGKLKKDVQECSFFLPKGCYATVAVRSMLE